MLRPYQKINRRKSRVINIGNIKIGGNNPIAVQTMTNTLINNPKIDVCRTAIKLLHQTSIQRSK